MVMTDEAFTVFCDAEFSPTDSSVGLPDPWWRPLARSPQSLTLAVPSGLFWFSQSQWIVAGA